MSYTINGKAIGKIGFGAMSLSLVPEDQAFAAIKAAIDSGCNYINAGEFYGPPDNNSLTILRKYFDSHPEDVSKIVLGVKGGFNVTEVRPAATRKEMTASIENCLNILGPNIPIDQYEPARKDPKADFITETLATVNEYVQKGKIGTLALSDLGTPDTVREAAKHYKISSLEIEFSMFRLDPLTNGLLETCAELGIAVVAYSPLGKGFLTGQIKSHEDLAENDMRRHFPRFSPENFPKNIKLVESVEALAKKKACTPGQIAIGWLLAISKRQGMPTIIPIPGSSNADRVKENSVVVDLSLEDLAEIDKILESFVPAGDRYPAFLMASADA